MLAFLIQPQQQQYPAGNYTAQHHNEYSIEAASFRDVVRFYLRRNPHKNVLAWRTEEAYLTFWERMNYEMM
jgi:hypothetical protein